MATRQPHNQWFLVTAKYAIAIALTHVAALKIAATTILYRFGGANVQPTNDIYPRRRCERILWLPSENGTNRPNDRSKSHKVNARQLSEQVVDKFRFYYP
jgi:hypothetical protein